MPGLNLDPEMLDVFKRETSKQLTAVINLLLKVEKKIDTSESIKEIRRCLHTVKGDARMIGLSAISKAAHSLEDMFKDMGEHDEGVLPEQINSIFKIIDTVQDAVNRLPEEILEINPDEPEKTTAPPTHSPQPLPQEPGKEKKQNDKAGMLTINIGKVDYLIKSSSVFLRFSNRFAFILNRLQELHERLAADGTDKELLKFSDSIFNDYSRELASYDLHTKQFQDNITKFKLVPLGLIFDVFPRLVRDIAETTGKSVEFTMAGMEIELEKNVVEDLKTLLIHLLRNAVDHGCEEPDLRRSSGKDKTAKVSLKAYNQGENVVIEVGDDGKGIEIEKIKKRILEKKYLSREEMELLSEDELIDFIFESGFSTKSVGEYSGRGVGLDYVASMVKKMNGQINIKSELNKGTTFIISLPVISSYLPVVVFSVDNILFGIPSSSVIAVIQTGCDKIKTFQMESQFLSYKDLEISFIDLLPLFSPGKKREGSLLNIMLLKFKDEIVSTAVDEIVLEKKLLIRRPQGLNEHLNLIIGAVLLGEERAIPVLNIPAFFSLLKSRKFNFTKVRNEEQYSGGIYFKKVLLVEDSPITRIHEKNILARQKLNLFEAANGEEALKILKTTEIDLLITDIEMPVMNGLELVKSMKGKPEFAEIPIIAISSYDTYRQKLLDLGISYFITKNDFSAALLIDTLKKLCII